jgi:pyruvate dehydrogenase E1 component
MKRMLGERREEFHYITLVNESYPMPSVPVQQHADLLSGAYRVQSNGSEDTPVAIRLLGSGAILREVIAAAEILRNDWSIASDVFSVTSYSELARDAAQCQRQQRLGLPHPVSTLERLFPGKVPILAASDWVRAWPQSIAEYLPARLTTLGTDGFGRSDTRERLRRFFEVDRYSIVLSALQALVTEGTVSANLLAEARQRYAIDRVSLAPWQR